MKVILKILNEKNVFGKFFFIENYAEIMISLNKILKYIENGLKIISLIDILLHTCIHLHNIQAESL